MYKSVLDSAGNKLEGVYKLPNGAILVDDPIGLNKYNLEKTREKRISDIEAKVDKILELLLQTQK